MRSAAVYSWGAGGASGNLNSIMIDVVNVTHHYGVKPVLRQVNLHVERGEVLAIMGPNGMGKSTLMGVLAGALWPLKGYVEIDGRRRRDSEEAEIAIRRKVVYLPAEPWVPLGRSGREWLLAVGRVYQIEDDRLLDHVDRLLALFDLTEHGDSAISSYSTGQRKKIALAATLVTEAPIMLLDEPFAGGLDPSGILALRRVLQRLAQGDDYTIVMATPVPELVEELADRIAIIRDGRVIAHDTIAGLRRLAGCDGKLEEVYERLVRPQTTENVDKYFAPSPS
jgi:ABC-2 type transport system ATP-binding protein